jgi:hypothetical protein
MPVLLQATQALVGHATAMVIGSRSLARLTTPLHSQEWRNTFEIN